VKFGPFEVLGAFACDDVRFEIGGKYTIVGAYGGDSIGVPTFPWALRLWVVLLTNTTAAEAPTTLQFRVLGPSGDPIMQAQMQMQEVKAGKGVLVPIFGFASQFSSPGTLTVQANNNSDWQNVHILKVEKGIPLTSPAG
jgi:hypothetical protein